ncbi:MAG TPA: hypothetical protein VN285_06325 [Candidatus Deferrimicrobium sp.]|nr:hypothetical protein [Candidatus Deferrimicrobium sp.]
MLLRIALALVAMLTVVAASGRCAGFTYEVGLAETHADNVLKDSTGSSDTYSIAQATIRSHPLPVLELNFTDRYTYFSRHPGLSNFLHSGGATFIPTPERWPFSAYLSASFDIVQYRQQSEPYDNRSFRFLASLGYELDPAVRLKAGSKITLTSYVNDTPTVADHDQYEAFAGLNVTVLGAYSLDVELGLGRTNLWFLDTSLQAIPPPPYPPNSPADSQSAGHFQSFYISPRVSRSLGGRTGVSITYKYRRFTGTDPVVVFGYTTGYLSPWFGVYDGSSVTVNVKSYLVPHTLLGVGVGYWQKEYLKTLEMKRAPFGGLIYQLPREASRRRDYLAQLYVNVQRPITVGEDGVLEPTITIEYAHNNSSIPTFDYSAATVSVGVVFRR